MAQNIMLLQAIPLFGTCLRTYVRAYVRACVRACVRFDPICPVCSRRADDHAGVRIASDVRGVYGRGGQGDVLLLREGPM